MVNLRIPNTQFRFNTFIFCRRKTVNAKKGNKLILNVMFLMACIVK